MKSILPLITLLLIIGSCKKDKEKDHFSGQFALTIPNGGTPQYINAGIEVSGGFLVYTAPKYIWKIEKAVDDKYYISSTKGLVIASDASGALVMAPKITIASDTQLFKFIPSGDNNNTYYIQLASNPDKYISVFTSLGSVKFGTKDAPCVFTPGIYYCFLQKFALVP
jgi:hypothetical protein